MTDYPERINISPVHRQKLENDFYLVDRAAFPGKGVEYIRADAVDAKAQALHAPSTDPVTVKEAARVIMGDRDARNAAFDGMWVIAEKHSLEATNSGGARYSITGDVVNELYYAALRAIQDKTDE